MVTTLVRWVIPALLGAFAGIGMGPFAMLTIPVAVLLLVLVRSSFWKKFAIGMLLVAFPFAFIIPAGFTIFDMLGNIGGGSNPPGPDRDDSPGRDSDGFVIPGIPGTIFDDLPPIPPPPMPDWFFGQSPIPAPPEPLR